MQTAEKDRIAWVLLSDLIYASSVEASHQHLEIHREKVKLRSRFVKVLRNNEGALETLSLQIESERLGKEEKK